MSMPNLNAVDLQATAIGPLTGRIRLELIDFDMSRVPLVVRRADVDASALARSERYRFEFEPIRDSDDHRFRLDISSSPDAPSSGVAFWATKGKRYANGTLLTNERERWADLAFQTHTPARRTLSALLDGRYMSKASGAIALAGLFVSWLAIGVVLLEVSKPGSSPAS
jgi:hypothetical protein